MKWRIYQLDLQLEFQLEGQLEGLFLPMQEVLKASSGSPCQSVYHITIPTKSIATPLDGMLSIAVPSIMLTVALHTARQRKRPIQR